VVDDTQGAPGIPRALLRATVFLLPNSLITNTVSLFAAQWLGPGPTPNSVSPWLAAFTIPTTTLIIAALFSTARRRNGFAGLHDLASRTRVVLRPRAVEARDAGRRSGVAADFRLKAEATRAVEGTGSIAGSGEVRVGPYLVTPDVKAAAL